MSVAVAASNEQIIALYESSEGQLSLEELYEAFSGEINISAIKMALISGSALYRKKAKESENEVWSKDDEELTKQVLRQLCIGADSDMVKLRAVCRIRDEKSGRLDSSKLARGMNFNVTLINTHIQEAEKAIEAAKAKVIEINPAYEHLRQLTD